MNLGPKEDPETKPRWGRVLGRAFVLLSPLLLAGGAYLVWKGDELAQRIGDGKLCDNAARHEWRLAQSSPDNETRAQHVRAAQGFEELALLGARCKWWEP